MPGSGACVARVGRLRCQGRAIVVSRSGGCCVPGRRLRCQEAACNALKLGICGVVVGHLHCHCSSLAVRSRALAVPGIGACGNSAASTGWTAVVDRD
eukprot:152114-Chlamydomonas_euryale.AAC.3